MPGWDPKSVDVDAFLAWAIQTTRQTIPGAELVRIDATAVYPDGHADLTLSSSGFLAVQFLSPCAPAAIRACPSALSPTGAACSR